MDIALIDYGAGNLTSVVKGFGAVGAGVRVVDKLGALGTPDAIVIPGVGHFSTTASLDAGWHAAVHAAIDRGVPLLGICVGLQWLFEGSDEAPELRGLGVLPGRCFRLERRRQGAARRVEHRGGAGMGADGSSADCRRRHRSISRIRTPPLKWPPRPARRLYGVPFSAAVEERRVFGVQFHPEKSGANGLKVLGNFLDAVRNGR